MATARLNFPRVETSYIQLTGGLDLVSPQTQVPPGTCIDAQNFVPEINGGYTRIGGYERFDGRPKPSEQDYHVITVTTSGEFSVGDTIEGALSGATAYVTTVISSTQLLVCKVTGTFTPTENLEVSAIVEGTITEFGTNNASTPLLAATYENATADVYRADIGAVPGEGSILGVWVYGDDVYAFRNNVGSTEAKMYKASASGWTEIITGLTLTPSGRYEFVNYNFTGAATGLKMYGCDGVNKAFHFDGTTFTQITTGASPDTPDHIAAHRNRLFLSIAGSVMISNAGDPATWSAGGTEIGVGDDVTALQPLPGDANTGALAIYSKASTHVLYGTSNLNWLLQKVAPDSGGVAFSVAYIGAALGLDDRGVTMLGTSDQFGNFEQATISRRVQPFINNRRGTSTASSVLRSQNQYRLYFSDQYGLAFQIENRQVVGIMPFYYENPVEVVCSAELSTGDEVVFFGSDNGYVYEAEKGQTFDGEPIEAWIRLAFNPEKSPRLRKRWRRCQVEMDVPQYVKLHFTYALDYGSYDLPVAALSLSEIVQDQEEPGAGGFWDGFTWDEFTWDSPIINPPQFDITGTAKNISMLFYQTDELSDPFTLQSVMLHYTSRRLER